MTKFLEFLQYSPKLFSFWDLVGTALNAPWYDVRNFMDEASKIEKKLGEESMNVLRVLGFPYTMKDPKSIYIGLVAGLGDLVLAAPTIAALKKKFPKANLCLGIGPEAFYDIIANDPNIDEFDTSLFYYPPTKSIRKLLTNKIVFLKKKLKYDLVIFFNNADGIKMNKGNHLIDNFAQLGGITLECRRPIVYLNEEDIAQGETIIEEAGIKKTEPFIVISPETRFAKNTKEWPAEKFRDLVISIQRKFSIQIITFVPPTSKKEYPGTVTVKTAPTIRSIAAVIKRSSLYIGCDNGLTHIASSFDVKTISIHIGYPIELSGALSPKAVIISNPPFLPAGKRKEPFVDPNPITVMRVFKEVEKALADC